MVRIITSLVDTDTKQLCRASVNDLPDVIFEEIEKPEEALMCLEQGTESADVWVLGTSVKEPLELAHRVHNLEKGHEVVILSKPEEFEETNKAVLSRSDLQEDVRCCSVTGQDLAGVFHSAVEDVMQRRAGVAKDSASPRTDWSEVEPVPVELHHPGSFLECLWDHAPFAVVVVNTEAEIIDFNNLAPKLFGFEAKEAKGLSLCSLFPEEQRSLLNDFIDSGGSLHLGDADVTSVELEATKSDGSMIYVETTASFVKEGMAKDFVLVIFRDISRRKKIQIELEKAHNELEKRVIERTADLANANEALVASIAEHERAEAALQQERYFLHSLMDSFPERIYFKDSQCRFTRINKAFAEVMGLSNTDEAVGKSDSDFFEKKHADQAFADEQEIMRTGQSIVNKEEKFRTSDGQEVWFSATKMPLFNEEGEVVGTFGVSRDITESKKADEMLREKNKQMEADLTMAREIQQSFLPQQYPTFPRHASVADSALHFYHRYEPSEHLAGDFFDILRLSDTRAGILICDVMGHGVRASLVTALLRGLVEELMSIAADPCSFMTELNRGLRTILRTTGYPMFVTAFYLVVDVSVGKMRYANAGHPDPIWLRRETGETELLGLEDDNPEPALGFIDEFVYTSWQKPIVDKDLIMLFTDGIFEVHDEDGEEFGKDRLFETVESNRDLPAAELFEKVYAAVKEHNCEPEFQDDVCMLAVEVNKKVNRDYRNLFR